VETQEHNDRINALKKKLMGDLRMALTNRFTTPRDELVASVQSIMNQYANALTESSTNGSIYVGGVFVVARVALEWKRTPRRWFITYVDESNGTFSTNKAFRSLRLARVYGKRAVNEITLMTFLKVSHRTSYDDASATICAELAKDAGV